MPGSRRCSDMCGRASILICCKGRLVPVLGTRRTKVWQSCSPYDRHARSWALAGKHRKPGFSCGNHQPWGVLPVTLTFECSCIRHNIARGWLIAEVDPLHRLNARNRLTCAASLNTFIAAVLPHLSATQCLKALQRTSPSVNLPLSRSYMTAFYRRPCLLHMHIYCSWSAEEQKQAMCMYRR